MCASVNVTYIGMFARSNSHALISAYKFNRHCCTGKVDQNAKFVCVFVFSRTSKFVYQ